MVPSHVLTVGSQLLKRIPEGVRVFLVIGGELVVLQVVYSLVAKVLGFDDLI